MTSENDNDFTCFNISNLYNCFAWLHSARHSKIFSLIAEFHSKSTLLFSIKFPNSEVRKYARLIKKLFPSFQSHFIFMACFLSNFFWSCNCSIFVLISIHTDFSFPWRTRKVFPWYFFLRSVTKAKIDFKEAWIFCLLVPIELKQNVWCT